MVTGGTKGIGKAAVEELCGLGAAVFTCARSQEALDQCLAEWSTRGWRVGGIACDVGDADQRSALVKAAATFFGALDKTCASTVLLSDLS